MVLASFSSSNLLSDVMICTVWNQLDSIPQALQAMFLIGEKKLELLKTKTEQLRVANLLKYNECSFEQGEKAGRILVLKIT